MVFRKLATLTSSEDKRALRTTSRTTLMVLGLAAMLLIIGLSLLSHDDPSRNTPLTRLNAVWYDLRFQLFPPQRDAQVPIIIVDLDEATQQREGRWPWDRRKVARLIHTLQDYGTALIGFDVVFSEPTVNPVQQLLDTAKLPTPVQGILTPLIDSFDGDKAMADALGDNTVLGYFLHADGGKVGTLPPAFLELSEAAAKASTVISMPDYTANLSSLTNHALASGFVVARPDADGIVRRMPLVMRHGTGMYTSLSLELVRLAVGATWVRLGQDTRDGRTAATHVQIGKHLRVPLDEYGNVLVPYRGPAGSFMTVSATGVLRGDAPVQQLEALNGAIVLVGTSALGLSDLRTIPLQTSYPGVEVHANVIDTMLTAALPGTSDHASPFYVRPDWAAGATLSLLIVVGLLLALALPGRTPPAMLALTAFCLVLVVGINVMLWHVWHVALPVALQLLMVFVVGGINVAGGYVATNRQKRAIQTLFGEYVPAGHVARMIADPGAVSLEGEQRMMTVLFADVRNFTALSESLSATELKAMLNRYLSAITAVIFEHQGTIDKYVGDLVMAFWNAPLNDPHHAQHAVQAALAMQARMTLLRQEFGNEGLPVFHIGIGVNTGMMNVGDMGSEYRRAYTVLGDAVNLASRLESLTDFYQVPILVSDTTRAHAPGILYRTVDRVRVKGRRQALDISQPIDPAVDGHKAQNGLVEKYQHALTQYRHKRWEQARPAFAALAQSDPKDALYRLYLNRMSIDLQTLPEHWDAVHQHEAK